MKETRIQIADDPDGGDDGEPRARDETQYRNLWVPLVVVPAGIVIAIVTVFALFGALGGEEASVARNLELVVTGGKNQRDQALFNLARQASENQRATNVGDPLPWAIEEGFGDRVRAAIDEVDEDDHATLLTLAVLLATMGDGAGVDLMVEYLDIDPRDDPEGRLRFGAIENLGLIGDPRGTPAVLSFLENEDEGLRIVAASALGVLPGEGVREGLFSALHDDSLAVRGTAALSLLKLDPPDLRAADVLRDLTEVEVYEAANELDRKKYKHGRDVSRNRVQAIAALGRLRLAEDRALFEALRKDDDLLVVEAAMGVLEKWESE